MQNEIPYYLQQYEITKSQLTYFSQKPNATESFQMTMNPYLIGGSSITSNKPLMVFTGTDPEYFQTENLKLQYVNRIQINTTRIINIHDSDVDLSEKITEILNIYEKDPQILEENHPSKNGVTIAEYRDIALLNVDKNSKIIKTNHKSTKNQVNHFTNT